MLSPEALPGGEVSASGLMFWIARAGGQKVTIRSAERGRRAGVPHRAKKFWKLRKIAASAEPLDGSEATCRALAGSIRRF